MIEPDSDRLSRIVFWTLVAIICAALFWHLRAESWADRPYVRRVEGER